MGMAGTAIRVLGVGSRSMSTKVQHSIPKEIAKAIKPSSSTSEFRKFLGIPPNSRSQNALLISKFIRLYTFRSPGIHKDHVWEENLKRLLHGKDRVGLPEIAKVLSPQFNQPGGMTAASNAEDKQHQMGGGKAKGKKKTSKKK